MYCYWLSHGATAPCGRDQKVVVTRPRENHDNSLSVSFIKFKELSRQSLGGEKNAAWLERMHITSNPSIATGALLAQHSRPGPRVLSRLLGFRSPAQFRWNENACGLVVGGKSGNKVVAAASQTPSSFPAHRPATSRSASSLTPPSF